MNKISTIMFDLDGTLLSIDMKEFENIYYKNLSESFVPLIAPEDFMKILYSSVITMVKNTEMRTNEEVFLEAMEAHVGEENLEKYREIFENFYSGNFNILRASVRNTEEMQKATQLLKDKGYELVIATNPLFPKSAVDQRIEWSGVNPDHFSYVTYFETSHFCKPNIEYYQEILEAIGKKPEECMMVGNDALEDLIAGKLGITTYLVTDHLLNRNNVEIAADHIGTYEDFLRFAHEMPQLNI